MIPVSGKNNHFAHINWSQCFCSITDEQTWQPDNHPCQGEQGTSTQRAGCDVDVHRLPQRFLPCSVARQRRVHGEWKCHNTHTWGLSDIQARTGLPLALQNFLCMPKITDLMAYLFPTGCTWSGEVGNRRHRNTDQIFSSTPEFEFTKALTWPRVWNISFEVLHVPPQHKTLQQQKGGQEGRP